MGKSAKSTTNTGAKPPKYSVPRSHNQARKQDRDSISSSSTGLILPTHPTTHTVPPSNWPSSLPYLPTSHLHPSTLSPHQLSQLHPATLPTHPLSISSPTPATYTPFPNPLIEIRPIIQPSHPAFPQSGLFAAKQLPPGTLIVDYTGVIHSCPQPSCSTSDYDLAFLDRDAGIAIDSAQMGNESRFVNDYHGIREEGPNAVFEEYFVRSRMRNGREGWEARMGVWVKPLSKRERGERKGGGGGDKGKWKGGGRCVGEVEGIAKGEEICVSYGRGWWRARRGVMEGWEDEVTGEEVEVRNDSVVCDDDCITNDMGGDGGHKVEKNVPIGNVRLKKGTKHKEP